MRRLSLVFVVLSGWARADSPPATQRAEPLSVSSPDQIGTEHPTILEKASATAAWVSLCQARKDTNGDGKVEVKVGQHGDLIGDAMQPYLVLGSGTGEAIEDFVAADPNGRYLVVIRPLGNGGAPTPATGQPGRLVLVDSANKTEVDLSALGGDARDDPNPFGVHRAASFDRSGRRMSYIAKRAGATRVVVRELATGHESLVDPGPGELFRARLDDDGEWVHMLVVAKDTDGNGKLEWPRVKTSLAPRRCRGPVVSYNSSGRTGDDVVTRFAPSGGGVGHEVAGFLRTFGSSLLVRDSKGALLLESARGKRTELVPPSCGGKVLDADPSRGIVAMACASKSESTKVEIFGAKDHRALDVLVKMPPDDSWTVAPGRFVWLEGSRSPFVLDFETLKIIPLVGCKKVLAVGSAAALGSCDNATSLVNLASGDRIKLDDSYESAQVERSGPVVAILGTVVDLDKGQSLGRHQGFAFAVSNDGKVLVSYTPPLGLPLGPLHWVRPQAEKAFGEEKEAH